MLSFCTQIDWKGGEILPKLTEKQKRFCEEYLIDLNATQAAIRAGYSPKTADRTASENLRKPEVKHFLEQLMQERSERTRIKADDVLQELRKIAYTDAKISGKEKIKALELLGKHLGLFETQNQASGEQELPALQKALENNA